MSEKGLGLISLPYIKIHHNYHRHEHTGSAVGDTAAPLVCVELSVNEYCLRCLSST